MHFGIVLSAILHGGLLVGVLLALASPKLFAALPEEPVTVEIVTPDEIAPPSAPHPAEPSRQASSLPEPPAGGAPPPPLGSYSAFDTSSLVALYNLRVPTFDAPAEKSANLTGNEVAAFKAHLRRCWHPPASLPAGSTTRVVLRVFLAPDGALQAEPMLIEAHAAPDGPQVMQTAMRALQQCQPYGFLPRERYDEWRMLDVGFSAREMVGG